MLLHILFLGKFLEKGLLDRGLSVNVAKLSHLYQFSLFYCLTVIYNFVTIVSYTMKRSLNMICFLAHLLFHRINTIAVSKI